jgi:hypothetical protein
MVSINTAIQVDLLSQVCSEAIGGRQYSGAGGAMDFAYGATHAKGGRSIIALNATAKNGTLSRISAVLPQPVQVDDTFARYLLHVGELSEGEWVFAALLDGVYGEEGLIAEAEIVIESIAPMHFVLN